MIAVGKVKLIRQSCFVMGIRGSLRPLSGNKTILQGRERAGVLTGRDISSLGDKTPSSLVSASTLRPGKNSPRRACWVLG